MRKLVYSLVLLISTLMVAQSFGQTVYPGTGGGTGGGAGGGTGGNGSSVQFIPVQGFTPVDGGTLEEVEVQRGYYEGWEEFSPFPILSWETVPSFHLEGHQFATDGYYGLDSYYRDSVSLAETEISAFGTAFAQPFGVQYGSSLAKKQTNGATAKVNISGSAGTHSRMFQTSGPISSAKAIVAWKANMPATAKFGIVKVTTTLVRTSAGGHVSDVSAFIAKGHRVNTVDYKVQNLSGVELLEYPRIFLGGVCDVGVISLPQSLDIPLVSNFRGVPVPFNANYFQTVSYCFIKNDPAGDQERKEIHAILDGSMFMPTGGQMNSGYFSGTSTFEATVELELSCYSVYTPALNNFPKIGTPAP